MSAALITSLLSVMVVRRCGTSQPPRWIYWICLDDSHRLGVWPLLQRSRGGSRPPGRGTGGRLRPPSEDGVTPPSQRSSGHQMFRAGRRVGGSLVERRAAGSGSSGLSPERGGGALRGAEAGAPRVPLRRGGGRKPRECHRSVTLTAADVECPSFRDFVGSCPSC